MGEAEKWMHQALALANRAKELGEVPVAAILVKSGEIIGQGYNSPISMHDPTAHAEIIALREAGRRQKNYRLPGATLYVTMEPCPMCAGAIVNARISNLVYGASDPKAGAVNSVFNSTPATALNHQVQVISGVLADDCAMLLQNFFKERR